MLVKQFCQECNQNFYARQSDINRGYAKFCSKICSAKHLGRQRTNNLISNTICDMCGQHFHRSPSKKLIAKSGFQFCSRVCKDSAQKIGSGFESMHPSHFGQHNSYRSQALLNKPNQCNRCGYNKCVSILVVHHIDRDRNNSNLSNLEILCRNCHYEEHIKDGYSIP